MPTDSQGRFHLNSQKAMAADKTMTSQKAAPSMASKGTEDESKGISMHAVHDHGDGTFHTESNGERTEHGSAHEALAHVGSKMTGGKHVHVHGDGGAMHSANADENGTDAHDHANMDELKSNMDQFLDEEGNEKKDDDSSQDNSKDSHENNSYRMLSGL